MSRMSSLLLEWRWVNDALENIEITRFAAAHCHHTYQEISKNIVFGLLLARIK